MDRSALKDRLHRQGFPVSSGHIREGQLLHGFLVRKITELPGIRCQAIESEHVQSGASLIHLFTPDSENFFSAAFRTPPPDSTGLPHILEHTVLSGSCKYPLKDPFIQLLKTSMVTFMNAFTYPDRTVYPCSSRNRKDFRNLVEVYCDAVLHPRLDRFSFMQEGHHLDFRVSGKSDSGLTVKGVVYNEMKGAYSDPEESMEEHLARALFPDSIYRLDSGGDPEHIPELTYEDFRDFHHRYYHPSNCWFFLYGDIRTEDHFEFLNRSYLSDYQRMEIDTTIDLQPRWNTPRFFEYPLAARQGDGPTEKSSHVSGWLGCPATDARQTLSMHLIDDYLLGNDAAPLKKALIESGLGMGLVCTGYNTDRLETVFTAGLKGIERKDSVEVSRLINDTLACQVQQGLDRERISSSLHRLELASREIGSAWPLRLMDRVYRSWMANGDPLYWLRLDEHLGELADELKSNPDFPGEVMFQQLCSNPHRADITFYPDPELIPGLERAFRNRMDSLEAELTSSRIEEIRHNAESLEEMQSAPDSPEALASLPRLRLDDVSSGCLRLPTDILTPAGIPLLVTDVFCNGLCYFDMRFDLNGLDPGLLPLVPLFCDAVTGMGAGDASYVEMASREASCCAGISAHPSSVCSGGDTGESTSGIHFSSQCLETKLPGMLDVLANRILRTDFRDQGRLEDLIREEAASVESTVLARGNAFAVTRAAAGFSLVASSRETFDGVSSLGFFSRLAAGSVDTESLSEKLEHIRSYILQKMGITCSVACGPDSVSIICDWLSELPSGRGRSAQSSAAGFPITAGRIEGISLPAAVSYLGFSIPGVPFTHPGAPALRFLSRQLSLGYLWDEIRVKRGAYGAGASLNTATGIFSMNSYRDPDIRGTIHTFRGVTDHIVHHMDLSPDSLESGIISTLKELDPPRRPGSAVRTAMFRLITGTGPEELDRYRSRLLALKPDDIHQAVTEILQPAMETGSICVISGREQLEGCCQFLEGLTITDLTDA